MKNARQLQCKALRRLQKIRDGAARGVAAERIDVFAICG